MKALLIVLCAWFFLQFLWIVGHLARGIYPRRVVRFKGDDLLLFVVAAAMGLLCFIALGRLL